MNLIKQIVFIRNVHIETNCELLKEIQKEEFERILAIVTEQIRKSNEMSAKFEKLQKPFGINV